MKTVSTTEELTKILTSRRAAIFLIHWTPPVDEEELLEFKTKIDDSVNFRFTVFESSFESFVKKCRYQPILYTCSLKYVSHALISACENYMDAKGRQNQPSLVVHKSDTQAPIFVPFPENNDESYDDILKWYEETLDSLYDGDKKLANERRRFNEDDHLKNMFDIQSDDIQAVVLVPPRQSFPHYPKYKPEQIRQADVAWVTAYLAYKHSDNAQGIVFLNEKVPGRYDYPVATDDNNSAFIPQIGWVSGLTVTNMLHEWLEPESLQTDITPDKEAWEYGRNRLCMMDAIDKYGVIDIKKAENKHLNYVPVETKAIKFRFQLEKMCAKNFQKTVNCVAICLLNRLLHRPHRFCNMKYLKRTDHYLLYSLIAENLQDAVAIYICHKRLVFSQRKKIRKNDNVLSIPPPTLNDIRMNRNFATYPVNAMHQDTMQPYIVGSRSFYDKQYATQPVSRKGIYTSGEFDKASWLPIVPQFVDPNESYIFPINGLPIPSDHKGAKGMQLVCSQNSQVGAVNRIGPLIEHLTYKNLNSSTPAEMLLNYAQSTGPIKGCYCPDVEGVLEVVAGAIKYKNGGLPVVYSLGDGNQQKFVKELLPIRNSEGKVEIKGTTSFAERMYKNPKFKHMRILGRLRTEEHLRSFKSTIDDLIFTFSRNFSRFLEEAKVI